MTNQIAHEFYTQKLGFKVGTDRPLNDHHRWIELLIPGAESRVTLFTPDGCENRIGGFQPLTFWCDDSFATAKMLKSKGVEFATEPKAEEWGTLRSLKDGDGNQFVISSK